jgi:endonuclease/exonuclease/phosphatase family metal-dependent hydrolase
VGVQNNRRKIERESVMKNLENINIMRSIWSTTRYSVRGLTIWIALMVGLLTAVAPAQAKSNRDDNERSVDVMQVNLYVGGGLGRVIDLDPADLAYFGNLIGTVTGIYSEILVSDPEKRLRCIASEILNQSPDIVSLQEVSLIQVQSPGDLVLGGNNLATNVVFDYLQILTEQLNKLGKNEIVIRTDEFGLPQIKYKPRYAIAAVTTGLDVELPMMNQQSGTIEDVRLTDRSVILVRTNQPKGQFSYSNPQSGTFTNLVVTDAGLEIPYGWCAVDMHIRGRDFRYICVHLTEETAPDVQILQAQELFAGPANVDLPVLIVGDFNTDPLHRDGSTAYDNFMAAGFKDAYSALFPKKTAGGLTWGHDEWLTDQDVHFDRRIDLALYRGSLFKPDQSKVLDLQISRKTAPLWASDHAALVTGFKLH